MKLITFDLLFVACVVATIQADEDCDDKMCAYVCAPKDDGSPSACFFQCVNECENDFHNMLNAQVIPLPRPFSFYDCYGDGQFNMKCFARRFGSDNNANLQEAFNEADTNANGFITPSELASAKWIFEETDRRSQRITGELYWK